MDGDEISPAEKLFQSDHLNAYTSCRIAGQNRVEADYLHLEPERAVGNDAADIAKSNNAESFVEDLDPGKFSTVPFTGSQCRVSGRDVARNGHHHRNGMFG